MSITIAEKVAMLQALIAEADSELERGDIHEGTPKFWEALLAEALRSGPSAESPEHLQPEE